VGFKPYSDAAAGHKNLRYFLLKAQRMAVTKTEFVAFQKAAWWISP